MVSSGLRKEAARWKIPNCSPSFWGCSTPAPVYDHTEEQLWRHLDTCQCQTYAHAHHAITQVTKALDTVRRQEHKALASQGDLRLQGTRYLWLWNEEKVPPWRRREFEGVKRAELKTSRAWAIKEALRPFWSYVYPKWAANYFQAWYVWATPSRPKPIIEAAKALKRHLAYLLTYFKHRITNATTEGINSKIQALKLMACGYQNRKHYKTAIYFRCGGLDLYPRAEGV